MGVTVRKLIRKLALGTASVVALGIAGDIASSALDYAANASNMPTAACPPAAVQASNNALLGDALRKDDVRWAQLELRNRGLYRGSLDGVLGSESKGALSRFQQINDLDRTGSLDRRTWEALTGNSEIGEGSSTPDHIEATTNSPRGKRFGQIGHYRVPKRPSSVGVKQQSGGLPS